MSDLFGASNQIFGGNSSQSSSKNSSLSNNLAYPGLSTALTPQVNNATGSSNQMANMLGLNGAQGQNQGFQNWQNSTGYQFGLDQGTQAITGNAAATGLLNSGATAKALNTYGQNYANTQYGNYFNQLMGLQNSGNQAAGVVAGAGQQSQSQGTSQSTGSQSSGGLGGALGSIGSSLGSLMLK